MAISPLNEDSFGTMVVKALCKTEDISCACAEDELDGSDGIPKDSLLSCKCKYTCYKTFIGSLLLFDIKVAAVHLPSWETNEVWIPQFPWGCIHILLLLPELYLLITSP